MGIVLIALALLLMVSVMFYRPPDKYVYGHIRIPDRGIHAEVYTTEHGQDCGCTSPLWHGGKVTVKADLSSVQVDDKAILTSLEGDKMVLECISITGVPGWLQKTDGDVLVVNGRWVYRFTKL